MLLFLGVYGETDTCRVGSTDCVKAMKRDERSDHVVVERPVAARGSCFTSHKVTFGFRVVRMATRG